MFVHWPRPLPPQVRENTDFTFALVDGLAREDHKQERRRSLDEPLDQKTQMVVQEMYEMYQVAMQAYASRREEPHIWQRRIK